MSVILMTVFYLYLYECVHKINQGVQHYKTVGLIKNVTPTVHIISNRVGIIFDKTKQNEKSFFRVIRS